MTRPSDEAVDISVRIAAPPEVVFTYFVDREKLLRWMGQDAVVDARPGGTLRVEMTASDVALGEFVEISPPSRLVFTWGWERGGAPLAPGSSTVEVTLTPDGDGTLVRLVHADLPAPMVPSHGEGWVEHFAAALVRLGEAGALV